jgi:hypothetical protein
MNNEEYFQHLFSGLPGSLVGGAEGAIALGTTLSNCGNNEAAAQMFEAAEWAEVRLENSQFVLEIWIEQSPKFLSSWISAFLNWSRYDR